eukprot:TRINITY_DN2491_c0_g1_i2.p1 TRINITY_DN2491_c0_g1~~TRINITY_DN2491_c0_g1_i2.p1  ORF type:complete len:441 (+),score=67.50 TRINITY_DN2491_c0_g1_i2:308-1630(+)
MGRKLKAVCPQVIAHTCDPQTDFDTVIEVHSLCDNDDTTAHGSHVARNNNYRDSTGSFSCSGYESLVRFQTRRGATYLVLVTGFNATATGVFKLYIDQPENYECSAPTWVDSYKTVVDGNTSLATPSLGNCQKGLRQGLWYQMKTRYSYMYELSTCFEHITNFPTVVELYKSCGICVPPPCDEMGGQECTGIVDDKSCAPMSHLSFVEQKEDQIYFIFVTGVDHASGNFRLAIHERLPSASSSDVQVLSSSSVVRVLSSSSVAQPPSSSSLAQLSSSSGAQLPSSSSRAQPLSSSSEEHQLSSSSAVLLSSSQQESSSASKAQPASSSSEVLSSTSSRASEEQPPLSSGVLRASNSSEDTNGDTHTGAIIFFCIAGPVVCLLCTICIVAGVGFCYHRTCSHNMYAPLLGSQKADSSYTPSSHLTSSNPSITSCYTRSYDS